MKKIRLVIAALSLITLFSACKKDDTPVKPAIQTTADKISSSSGKKWKITSMKAKFTINGKPQEQDVMNLVFDKDCEKDNITVLFSNKTYEEREGQLKCGSSDMIDTGSWELKKNDTELYITTSKTGSVNSTLKEISESRIIGEFPKTFKYQSGGTVDAMVTIVYTAL